MQKQLAEYLTELNNVVGNEMAEEDHSASSFQQCATYDDKANPIKVFDKIQLKFKCRDPTNRPDVINTSSLWYLLCGFIDDTHTICNNSMKKCNVQFLTRTLKDYLSDKTMHTFLTGRRAYPIMELLDRPRTKFEKKHQTAVGFLFSFLLDKKISICEVEFDWSGECKESVGNIDINPEGFWIVSKN